MSTDWLFTLGRINWDLISCRWQLRSCRQFPRDQKTFEWAQTIEDKAARLVAATCDF